MPLALFRSQTFTGANLLTLFLYTALNGLLFFLPFNLIQVQGYSATAAGAALLPFVLTMFLLSRWAGGLVERYGAKLPLVVGPIITAIGFALFALPDAESGSYWTSFFPPVMVMSIGMTASVAPLTTTVMGAVEERHVGVASGVNNAVSRVAALLAVAVFGIFMLNTFDQKFAERLQGIPVSSEVRAELLQRSGEFVNMKIPDTVDDEARSDYSKGGQTVLRQRIRCRGLFGCRTCRCERTRVLALDKKRLATDDCTQGRWGLDRAANGSFRLVGNSTAKREMKSLVWTGCSKWASAWLSGSRPIQRRKPRIHCVFQDSPPMLISTRSRPFLLAV